MTYDPKIFEKPEKPVEQFLRFPVDIRDVICKFTDAEITALFEMIQKGEWDAAGSLVLEAVIRQDEEKRNEHLMRCIAREFYNPVF